MSEGRSGAKGEENSVGGKEEKESKKNGHGERTFLGGFIHFIAGPVLLISLTPNFVFFIWYVCVHCDGSVGQFFDRLVDHGPLRFVGSSWLGFVHLISPLAVSVIAAYAAWALLLMVLLPGRREEGSVTPKGNVPVYKDNGFACYAVTMAAFVALTCALKAFEYSPTVVYDRYEEFLASMTAFSVLLCTFLYLKGHFYPSTTDHGSSGNFVFDFFWGTELHPRLFGVDVKVFTNCRFGMTVWPLLVCIFALKSYELHGFVVNSAWVSAGLQLIYVTKFFWWEAGYMRTIDISVDRAGYYICWGCLVFLPAVYTSVSLYLVNHPIVLDPVTAGLVFLAGALSCGANYVADRQKLIVRKTNGNCTIWGRRPEVIRATYRLENGGVGENLLLVSGFWGLARHFHYVPEVALSFFWTIPVLFENILPYTYVVYLTILLFHRTFRDDRKCKSKYRESWEEYVQRVPYRVIPYLF